MRLLKSCVLYLIIIVINGASHQTSAQLSMAQYLYIAQSADGTTLFSVNPQSSRVETLVLIETQPGLGSLDEAYLSPDGNMTALVFATGSYITITVLDLETQAMTNVAEDIILPLHFDSLATQVPQDLYWSPDSRYIAFGEYDVDAGAATIRIFNTETHEFIDLHPSDMLSDNQYMWSHDSQKLLVVRQGCVALNVCTTAFETFAPDTGVRIAHYTLTETPDAFGSGICELRWSPDGRYVVYVASCMMSAFDATKEVYLLDLVDGQLSQLTEFTVNLIPPLASDVVPVIYADYSLEWYSPTQLLIGVAYGSRLENDAISILYHITSQQTFQLLDTKGEDWELSLDTSLIAYRAVTTDFSRRTSHSLNISALSETGFQNIAQRLDIAPCNFDWSPDGTILAYTTQELFEHVYGCNHPIEQIEFLDVSTNQAIHSIPTESQKLIPLGWTLP